MTEYEKEILSVIKLLQACFHCRQTGHLVSECPLAQDAEMGVGNCYKCGSSEHTTKSCNYSKSTEAAGKLTVLVKTGWCVGGMVPSAGIYVNRIRDNIWQSFCTELFQCKYLM